MAPIGTAVSDMDRQIYLKNIPDGWREGDVHRYLTGFLVRGATVQQCKVLLKTDARNSALATMLHADDARRAVDRSGRVPPGASAAAAAPIYIEFKRVTEHGMSPEVQKLMDVGRGQWGRQQAERAFAAAQAERLVGKAALERAVAILMR